MPRRPFLKWAGSKYRVLGHILPHLPAGGRLVEPFAGSCAVYLNAPHPRALVADINGDLIALYQTIQREGEPFIEYCREFFAPHTNTREAFLAFRTRFNTAADPAERAALLLYLNRHAFNGLVRYNGKGLYNVPFGRYAKPYFPLAELRAFHHKTRLTETEFVCRDFRSVFAALQSGDVVYGDPPYVPLSGTANFTSYAGANFTSRDQLDVARLAEQARGRGIPVLLSNHDTPGTRELYAKADIRAFTVQRFISCNGNRRNAAPELLAVFR